MARKTLSRHVRVTLIVVGSLVVLLVLARLALPYFIKSYVNKTLDELPGYHGHVDDVDVALYRGAYSLRGVSLVKVHGSEREPLVSADAIDFSVDWHALLNKRIVCKIDLLHPELQFVQRATEEASQTKVGGDWQSKVRKLVPLEINLLTVENGLLRYKDETKSPKINLYINKLDLQAENISNADEADKKLPSTLNASAHILKSGRLKLKGRADFLASPTLADVELSVRDLDLTELNEYAKAYGHFDFKKGDFELTSALAATKSKYTGYVKTIAKHIEVLDWSKEKNEGKSTLHLLWEGLVGAIVEIFKNQRHDQFAARIPIDTSRNDIHINSWAVLGSILRNGFVQALSPKFENQRKSRKVI